MAYFASVKEKFLSKQDKERFLGADHVSFQLLLIATITPKTKCLILKLVIFITRNEEVSENKTYVLKRSS